MTYGQQLATMIVTANKLGISTGFTTQAQNVLKGASLEPPQILWFERAAIDARSAVLAAGLGKQADALAQEPK